MDRISLSNDGLVLWKGILQELKGYFNKAFFNSFFSDNVLKYYEYNTSTNTIFIKCENNYVYENIASQLEDIHNKLQDTCYSNINIQPITSDEQIKRINNIHNLNDNIISRYTFDNFVVGSSNRLPYAACQSVAEHPAFESPEDTYNPLFLYGDVGLGKTHLMHAIANRIKEKYPNKKISYVSSETFLNDLVSSIKDRNNKRLQEKYRMLDVLLIDDIQFIAGKEKTQEEFFNTFNELHLNNKQIIISSDRPPKDIETLEDRIKSRLQMGFTADINPPDFETRVAILKKKCELDKKIVPDDVLVLIAKNIKSNIRELEGALTKVNGYSKMLNIPVTYDIALDALKDIISQEKKELTMDYIQQVVANKFSISMEDMKSDSKPKNIAYPRQIAMYLCRELTDNSLPKIAKQFEKKDHTTVMHAHKKIKNDIDKKIDNIDITINKIIEELKY